MENNNSGEPIVNNVKDDISPLCTVCIYVYCTVKKVLVDFSVFDW